MLVAVSQLALRHRFDNHLLRDNHELLEGQTATGVGATVQDVLEGNGEDVGLLGSGEVGDVSVKGNTLLSGSGLGNSQRDTEDGVGTELALVGGSIELVQEVINLGLVLDIDVLLDDGGGNDLVDVLDGVENTCVISVSLRFFCLGTGQICSRTLAGPLGLVTIAELNGLVLT